MVERGWNTAQLTCPRCGHTWQAVYPAPLRAVQCECGQWVDVPLVVHDARRPVVNAN